MNKPNSSYISREGSNESTPPHIHVLVVLSVKLKRSEALG